MIRRAKTERVAQQQKAVCQALIQLMERKDFQQISVSEICQLAGIPRRTAYYYFDSKEDMLKYLLEYVVRESALDAIWPANSDKDTMYRGLVQFFRYWRDQRRRELEVLLNRGYAVHIIDRAIHWVSEESAWAEHIRQAKGLDVAVSNVATTVVFHVLFFWCRAGFTHSDEETAAYTADLLTKPIYNI